MPKFGEIVATDVWAAAARTLTDFSAEEIFDLPIFDDIDTMAVDSGAGSAVFGAWTQISADVGVGKRLLWLFVGATTATGYHIDIEVGSGASGSEVAIGRAVINEIESANASAIRIPFWLALADNIRLSIRVRDNNVGALEYTIGANIA